MIRRLGRCWLAVIFLLFVPGTLHRPLAAQSVEDGPLRQERSTEGGPFWQRAAATGSWNGLRPRLEAEGVRLEVVYTSDLFSGLAGGLRRGAVYLHDIDLTLDVDLDALVGWRGGRVLLYGMGVHGDSPSDLAGDVQALSSIDAPDGWRLYEAYVEQTFLSGRLSLLAGLYDLNGAFYVAETAGIFLNGAHGIGPEFGLSGENGPSIFPYTSLGLHARYEPAAHLYVQAAVFDGVPCGAEQKRLLPVRLSAEEGWLLSAEAGYRAASGAEGAPSGRTLAAGVWTYGTPDDALAAGAVVARRPAQRSFGFYGFAEQTLYRQAAEPTRRLDLYVRAGYARAAVNPVTFAWGGGLVLTGLLPRREADRLGLAVSAAHFGRPYLETQGNGRPAAEIAFELTYRLEVGPWLAIQPDVQYVLHPAGAPGVPRALALGQRLTLLF